MGNPLCPFCGRVTTSGTKSSYRADGAIIMVGHAHSWDCSWCGRFWWKGKSAIMRVTALTMDRTSTLSRVRQQVTNYLARYGLA